MTLPPLRTIRADGCTTPRRHPLALAVASLLVLLPASQAGALDLAFDAGVAVEHSDNIRRAASGAQDDTVVSPTVIFDVSQTGSRVQLAGNGVVQYSDYLDDTADDELRGGFSGGLEWAVVPSRINLVVEDYLSEQNINAQAPSAPDNLQQVNLFVAGPTFYTRLGPATRGQLDLRYGNTYAEEYDPFNGDRYSAALRVRHQTSASTTFTGNLEAGTVEHDRAGASSDYDRYDAFVGWSLERNTFAVELDAGYTRLEHAAGDGRSHAPLLRATATSQLSARSSVRLDLRSQYTDAAQYLITPTLDFGDRRFSEPHYSYERLDPHVFREHSARLRLEYDNGRLGYRVQPYYQETDYLDVLVEDQEWSGLALDAQYRLTPLFTLTVFANRMWTRGLTSTGDYDESTYDIGLVRRFNRRWSGSLNLRRRERGTDDPAMGYDENLVMVALYYSRGRDRQ